MRKSLFLAALGALALGFAGCSGGTATPPLTPPLTPDASASGAPAAPVSTQSTAASTTVTGKIVWVSTSATKLQIQPSSGSAQYVDIASGTQLNYNGLTPKVGEYASATGSGSPLNASIVTLSTSPITSSTSSTSSTSAYALSGKIVWVSSSATKLQIQPSSGSAQYVYIQSTTKLNYNGLTPKAGEYAGANGSGSPLIATSVTLSTSPLSTSSSTTATPAPGAAYALSGKIVWVSSSATKLQIQPNSGSAQYVDIQSTTKLNYNGLTPKAGEYAGANGSGSPLIATSVTLSTSPISSTSSTTATPAPGATATPAPRATATPVAGTSTGIKHITVIMMENNAYESIVGSSSAPYLNSLASRTAFFTSSSGVTHPSEPNYLAFFSGSTQGLTSDACPVNYSGANLATQLSAAGYSFAGYAEDMPSTPSTCQASASPYGSKYYYMRKHVPWASFTNVPSSVFHTWNGPGTALSGTVNFITPNMCDDMHDCSTSTGDTWLSKNIPAIESWDNANNGLLIVTFDEGEYSSTNHIYTVFDGPMIKAGKYSQSINHYNVLRFIEDSFHLAHLGNAGSAAAITGILK